MADDGRILVAVVDKTIYVKPVGFATQRNSLGVPDFVRDMFQEGCTNVAFDLSECVAMDSTFLGVIAAAGMMGARGGDKAVVVVNANQEARRELRMIGLMAVVALKDVPCELPADLELAHMDFVSSPKDGLDRIRRIKDLHKQLVGLNERNRKTFGSFVEMLEEELRGQ